MRKPEIDGYVRQIEAAFPLLTKYSPPGWKDFRDGTPSDLRTGIYVMPLRDGLDYEDSFVVKFQALLGCEEAAQILARDLQKCYQWLNPGYVSQPNVGNRLWSVEFAIPIYQLLSLSRTLDALRPKMMAEVPPPVEPKAPPVKSIDERVEAELEAHLL